MGPAGPWGVRPGRRKRSAPRIGGVGAGRFDEYAAFSTIEEPTSGSLPRFPPERALHLDEN
jgi:hypothetical protein